MGADIHAYAEAKIDSKWVPCGRVIYECVEYAPVSECPDTYKFIVDKVYDGRDYALFGKLAGVRGGTAIIKPRGFPDDASEKIRSHYDVWKGNAHTPTYWYLTELIKHKRALCYTFGQYSGFREVIDTLIDVAKIYKIDRKDIRVICWFDS
jgi:hypothetical protein